MASTSVQVIDETKEFHNVDSFIKSNNLRNAGLDYHVVAVFGSQSTGKSTLLNALFKTEFQVMNEGNRSQTTKGIWLAKADMPKPQKSSTSSASSADEEESGSDEFVKVGASARLSPEYETEASSAHLSNILVLDVEGTDGRERGEDQDFERKSALFALATSEVLIVNMWENQVGLYQGANMGLLKTVFEVNLSVFGKNKVRSVLLFVIRDYLGTTPLESLGTTIKADLTRVWSEISKPADLGDSKFDDFFDVKFFGLPHKVLQGEQFKNEVGKLSHSFVDFDNKDTYIFDPAYHRKVPADGWDMYARSVWDQIEQNKDLDLPTQQILVARFRCEELAGEAWSKFETLLEEKGLHLMSESSSPEMNFGTHAAELRTSVVALFDSMASRYHKTVYSEKRIDLLKKIDVKLSALFKHQLQLTSRQLISQFKSFKFDSNNGIESFKKLKNDSLASFDKAAKTGSLGVFDYTKEKTLFEEQLDEQEDIIKKEEIKKIIEKCNKSISGGLSRGLARLFSDPSQTTWTKVMDFFNKTVDSTIAPYLENGFNVGVNDTEVYVNQIRKTAWQNLDFRLKDIIEVDSVVSHMREHFENRFRFDENDIPIVWKPGDNIEKPFTAAREETDKILPIFAIAKLETGELVRPDVLLKDEDAEDDFDDEFAVRLSDENQQLVAQKFKRLADAAYVDAKRSTTQMSTQIPWFIFVIIAVLGWNEFIAVLRNPFLFMFAIMVLGGAYAVHALGMWGPVIRIANALITESSHVVRDKWNEVQEAAAMTENVKEENIDMTDLKSEKPDLTESEPTAMPGSF